MNLKIKPELDYVFMALNDETRRAIVHQLAKGECAVKDFDLPNPLSKSAVTKHLKILERAGLLRRNIVGREHICSLNREPIVAINQWLSIFEPSWDDSEEALTAYMDMQLQEN
ncbi:metalloregulator ArsR/SmtB family transcription factor [Vibrio sp. SCSIO 43136]|uniref:ArsR/SmtB family transcription factor n=1 Tax=Vibrio sp. SCSIO 43136 TaxID=2819101 RepID=UPI0020762B00|nr:metalloregulator ArsR/SmtB family transcription factor [Vibrio sp. SCSIO 43136]USD66951.1 helix-turn-helix transcriptional regulator [Vibrio sp. SCSIO 43136]